MHKALSPGRTGHKVKKVRVGLPSLKLLSEPTQLEELNHRPHQSISHSRDEVSPLYSPNGSSLGPVTDSKKDNTGLRTKLHEMHAHYIENSIKGKGMEKAGSPKSVETILVRANTKMYQLENILRQKDDQIQRLSFEKRLLENIRKDQAKAIEDLMVDKNFYIQAGKDLQAELTNIKNSVLNDLINENKSQKEKLMVYERRMKSDRDLLAKQLETIKILDDKNTEISRAKNVTLNPLYDRAKRTEIYRNKVLADANAKSEVDAIKALNLAFSTDEVLEKLLEEQNEELEEEELRKLKAKGEHVESPHKEKKNKDWEREYLKLRDTYIQTRFEFETIDIRLKEEINNLVKKLNQTEEKLNDKMKEHDALTQVLDHGRHVDYEEIALRASLKRRKRPGKTEKLVETSSVATETENNFTEESKEILRVEPVLIVEEKEEEKKEEEPKEVVEYLKIESQNALFPGGVIVKVGQFYADHTFDDQHMLIYYQAVAMDSIAVWAGNKSLLGIQVKYINKNGETFDGPFHMGNIRKEKYAIEPWKIDLGDWVLKVRGGATVTHGILWIEFTTRNGIVKKFGNSETENESFNFEFKPDEVPLIVGGSFSVRNRGEKINKLNLSGIGFSCVEKEETLKGHDNKRKEELKQEMKKLETLKFSLPSNVETITSILENTVESPGGKGKGKLSSNANVTANANGNASPNAVKGKGKRK